jgi:hypothetical protein
VCGLRTMATPPLRPLCAEGVRSEAMVANHGSKSHRGDKPPAGRESSHETVGDPREQPARRRRGRRDEVGPTGVHPMSAGIPKGKHLGSARRCVRSGGARRRRIRGLRGSSQIYRDGQCWAARQPARRRIDHRHPRRSIAASPQIPPNSGPRRNVASAEIRSCLLKGTYEFPNLRRRRVSARRGCRGRRIARCSARRRSFMAS